MARRETVVRGGKRVKKLVCPPGKKAKDNRCVTMTAKEKITRKKAGIKAARKAKGKQAQAQRKRKRSIARR